MNSDGLIERHPDWGISEWRELAVLNAKSLERQGEELERLHAEIERLLLGINRAGSLALQKASHSLILDILAEAKTQNQCDPLSTDDTEPPNPLSSS